MPVLPLRTRRLELRALRPADAPVVAAYRSDPQIARYQNWQLPFSVEAATAMLVEQSELSDVTPGRWLQIGIERDGRIVGDVAVRLDDTATTATLGYTLTREVQGSGIAAEAVGAVVDALFAEHRVHRITATVDPANIASMRVVESHGFRWEGTERSSFRSRGEWVDDVRFALLEPEWRAWAERPVGPADHIELTAITPQNLETVRRLKTHWYQRQFVAPMGKSLAEALVPPLFEDGVQVVPWFRAVVADGDTAGFVMVAAPVPGHPDPYLWRLLVDRHHQRRTIGRRVIESLVDEFRGQGCTGLLVSWSDGVGSPRAFYEGLGFIEVGPTEDGEVEGRLTF